MIVLAVLGAAALAITLADVLTPEYDPITEPVSRYVNGDSGWLITFAILAISIGAALLLWRRRGAGSRFGRGALALWSAGLLIAAIFPADPPGHWANPSASEMVHGIAAWIAVAAFPIGALLLSRTVVAWFSLATTVLFVVYMVDVMDGPSIPFGGLGLAERVMIGADLLWMATAAIKARDGWERSPVQRRPSTNGNDPRART